MAHELMDTYSDLADARLRASLVTRDNLIFNPRFEGDGSGRAVRIPVRDLEVAAKDYNKATGAQLGTGDTAYIDLLMDKDKAVNEIIDGYDALSVPDDIVADRVDSGAYGLALVMDKDSIAELEAARADDNANVSADTAAATKENAYELVCAAMTYHDTIGVPEDGYRWLIASPAFYAKILQDDNFVRAGDLSQQLRAQGVLGQVAGYNVFKSANLKSEFIAGHPNWCHRATRWIEDVRVKELSNNYIGASAVQGRMVYGVKVSKPQVVFIKNKA